jgi:hypothetical protein
VKHLPAKANGLNKGFDANKDGGVTEGETADKAQRMLSKGLGAALHGSNLPFAASMKTCGRRGG